MMMMMIVEEGSPLYQSPTVFLFLFVLSLMPLFPWHEIFVNKIKHKEVATCKCKHCMQFSNPIESSLICLVSHSLTFLVGGWGC